MLICRAISLARLRNGSLLRVRETPRGAATSRNSQAEQRAGADQSGGAQPRRHLAQSSPALRAPTLLDRKFSPSARPVRSGTTAAASGPRLPIAATAASRTNGSLSRCARSVRAKRALGPQGRMIRRSRPPPCELSTAGSRQGLNERRGSPRRVRVRIIPECPSGREGHVLNPIAQRSSPRAAAAGRALGPRLARAWCGRHPCLAVVVAELADEGGDDGRSGPFECPDGCTTDLGDRIVQHLPRAYPRPPHRPRSPPRVHGSRRSGRSDRCSSAAGCAPARISDTSIPWRRGEPATAHREVAGTSHRPSLSVPKASGPSWASASSASSLTSQSEWPRATIKPGRSSIVQRGLASWARRTRSSPLSTSSAGNSSNSWAGEPQVPAGEHIIIVIVITHVRIPRAKRWISVGNRRASSSIPHRRDQTTSQAGLVSPASTICDGIGARSRSQSPHDDVETFGSKRCCSFSPRTHVRQRDALSRRLAMEAGGVIPTRHASGWMEKKTHNAALRVAS